jgi:hypothetical protein
MIIMIGQDKRSPEQERRQVIRELIIDGMRLKNGVVEALDWEGVFTELHIPIGDGHRGQCRDALYSLVYKYHLVKIKPFSRDGERWGRYILVS